MLKTISLLLILALASFAAFVAVQPNDFRITRSRTIAAPAADLFAQVNNLRAWHAWSPWAPLDPDAKISFEGPEAGKDAYMRWEGNQDMGVGSMRILASTPNESIQFQLDIEKPFAAHNRAEFEFTQEGDATNVTWSMSGTNGFLGKAMGLIFNCDKMVGGQFETGLANLETIVSAPTKQ